jgi:hypothetical protein
MAGEAVASPWRRMFTLERLTERPLALPADSGWVIDQ